MPYKYLQHTHKIHQHIFLCGLASCRAEEQEIHAWAEYRILQIVPGLGSWSYEVEIYPLQLYLEFYNLYSRELLI